MLPNASIVSRNLCQRVSRSALFDLHRALPSTALCGRNHIFSRAYTVSSWRHKHQLNQPQSQLFGEEEDDTSELDEAAKAGENGEFIPTFRPSHDSQVCAATEIENLRKEASAFRNVRASMLSAKDNESAALVFNKVCPLEYLQGQDDKIERQVFKDDIARLLTMSDMWRFRTPPTPLDRSEILKEEIKVPVATHGEATGSNGKSASQPVQPPSTIKDQRELSLRDNVLLFDQRSVNASRVSRDILISLSQCTKAGFAPSFRRHFEF